MKNNFVYYFISGNENKSLQEVDHKQIVATTSEEELSQLKSANQKIILIYHFEEIFVMLTNSLREFNEAVFSFADRCRYTTSSGSDIFDKTLLINQKVINFCTIFQLYCDTIPKSFCQHWGYDKGKKYADNLLRESRSSTQFVRCNAIRDYLQHAGTLPLEATTSSNLYCPTSTQSVAIYFRVDPSIVVIERRNRKQQELLKSAFGTENKIDISNILAEAFDIIQNVHMTLRTMFDPDFKEAEQVIANIMKKLEGHFPWCIKCDAQNKFIKDIPPPYIAEPNMRKIRYWRQMYPCNMTIANTFVTSSSPEFSKKCRDLIWSNSLKNTKEIIKPNGKEKA